MIFKLRRRRPSESTIEALYGAIVAQARSPSFYLQYGVPDTVEGRFDMIALHVFLVIRRTARSAGEIAALGQALFDRFCRDLDHNLREMGVSDLAVPRKMRGFAEAYFGRAEIYAQALASGDRAAAAAALGRNVFSVSGPPGPGPCRLGNYMFEAVRRLDDAPDSAVAQGRLDFADPDAIPVNGTAGDHVANFNGSTLSSHC